jgi:hypothetical protein
MIVTVEARHGSTIPVIHRDDVMVYEGKTRDRVAGWTPLLGGQMPVQMFILIDDGLSTTVGSQLSDLQKFATTAPASVAIGVGYMRNGTVEIAQNPTTDHGQAAKALRLPMGDRSISPSPYIALADLMKRWPGADAAGEVVMITDGVDALNGGGPVNPYRDQAITASQKAGVIVYPVYAPGAGHYGHTYWLMNWGQNYLSQLSDETGGEAYGLFMGNPVSFTPYLDAISQRLTHQFLLSFAAQPENKAGMHRVTLRTEVPNVDLVGADSVYVPAGQ